MAEFKLGRIRFVWKNTWAGSTTYYKDDVVRYGGKTYLCLTGHTSSSVSNGFYTDLSSNYWQLSADGQSWTGTWVASTVYKIGDLVKYGGTVYICNTGHVASTTLETNQSYWDQWATSLNFIGPWIAGTTYKVADIVTYGATVYRCNTGHTAAATPALGLEANQSSWDVLNQAFAYVGAWSAPTTVTGTISGTTLTTTGGSPAIGQVLSGGSIAAGTVILSGSGTTWTLSISNGSLSSATYTASPRYRINDVVKYGAGLWICTTYHSSTNAGFATTNFARLVDGLEFSNSWSVSSAYAVGDTVTYGGYTYVAKTNVTNTSLSLASSVGNGTSVTYNFASQTIQPFVAPQSVTITGATGTLASNTSTGVGATAVFTASVTSSTTLSVSSVTSGTITVGSVISGTGVTVGTTILALLSGNGSSGASTWQLSTSQNFTSTTVSASANTGVATLVFNTAQSVAPFQIGQIITVSGFTGGATGYNGTQTVVSCTQTYLTFASSTTPYATGGTITITGYNGSYVVQSATSSSVTVLNTNIIPMTGGTITNSPPTTNTGSWGLLSTGFSYQSTWTTSTAYKIGAVVSFGAYTYLVTADHTSSATIIPPNASYYALLNPGMRWTTYATGASYVSPTNTTTSGTGSGATFTVGVNGTTYTVTKTGNGSGYSTNAVIKIAGTQVGGLTPANDILITVQQSGGAITTFTFTGLAVTWYSGSSYVLGDQVTMGYNSYICVLAHTAATGNRPDNDTTGTYWNQVASGAETNVLTTQGDIVYFGGAGATRLPIGTDGQVLKVVGTTPTWATFGQINNVYYVAPSGTDNYTNGYGVTLDKPFATIKYAASIVAAGVNNPNAVALLKANKTWMQNEMWYWSTYEKSVSASPFSPSSVYDQTKSYRDSGFIIDGVIYDLSRGGNSQTIFNAYAFFQPGTNTFYDTTVAAEMPYFIAMLTELASLMQNALTQTAPGTSYQTVMTAPNPVSQVTAGSAAESGATTATTTLMNYIITALTTVSTAALPSRSSGQSATIFVKTGTYNEILPISIPENCSLVGDELRTTIVQPASTTATVTGFISNGTNSSTAGTTLSVTAVTSGSVTNGMWLQSAGVIALPTQITSINAGTLNSPSIAATTVASTASVGSVTGSGPWTATLTGLSNANLFTVGATISATAGSSTSLSGMASSGGGVFTITTPSITIAVGMTVTLTSANTGTASNVTAGSYTITAIASQTQFTIAALATATSGTIATQTWAISAGSLYSGSPTSAVVTSIPSATSITYTVTGGNLPVAGPITAVTQTQLTAGASSTGLTVGGVLSGGSVTTGTYIVGQIYGASGTAVVNSVSSGTSGTNTITVTSNANIAIGQFVSGNGASIAGLPANTYVTGFTGTSVTLSNNLTASISSTAIYFFTAGGAGLYGINQLATGTPTAATSYTVTLSQSTASATITLNYTSGNMFYMRNGATLRNMTLQGLSGTLGTANGYGTQRPSAGAYVSLDPGTGPNDTSVWIFNRSPYVQNVTTFGTGCIGQKVDGALHNGGNQSITSNDFTQVLSDGIGAWVTNLGRAELVSVFTYYNNIGYLSENGGKIRATNGNNSYGLYGSVAEGVNAFETPITGTVNNRAGQASIGVVLANNSNSIYRVEYTNAGNNYSPAYGIAAQATTYTFNGGNNNAVAISDETRDNAVFETRVLSSGAGYIYVTSTPQAGDIATITLAATDNAISASYLGLRVIINNGTGSGQYGYIANYNASTKIALVAKESFTPIVVTNTTAVTNVLTVASTITLYSGMPVVFTGTAYTGSLLSTLTTYYIVNGSITSTTFQLATSAALAAGGSANAITLGTTSGSAFILNAAGWDHVIPGTAAVASMDTTTTYQIESRITYSSPSFTYNPGSITSAAWTASTYANGYYVAVAGTASGTNTAGYSTNGTSWTVGSTLPAITNWSSVAAGTIAGAWYYVAVANGSASSAYSTNGTSWTSMTGLPVGNWNQVAYGNGYFMTVNNGNNGCYISTTGTSWSVTGLLPSSLTWSCIAYGTGAATWVTLAGGTTPTSSGAYSINNGTTWTAMTLPVAANWTSVTWGNNRFVAVAQGSTAVIYSTNGVTWTQSPTGLITSYAWNNVKYGQGSFFATATTLNPTVSNTSSGNNLITLSSTTGLATGQTLVPTAVTQSTTASATTSATAVTNNNSIITGTVFTPGQVNYGTFATGMTLSGTGVYTGQGIAITSVSPSTPTSGSTTYTFATQATIPFQVNQAITVQGILPVGYNGTFTVTGATINTVVVSNATTGSTTALGTITSTPTYITAQTNFTSTSSTIVGTTLTVGGTITGTVAVGQYLSGVTWSNTFSQIIGTTLSLAGTTTGTVAANQYVAGYQATNTSATSTYVTSGTQISAVVNPTFTGQVSAGTAITFTGYTIGNILYVTSTPSSTGIVVGMTLAGTGITGGTYIVSNINGAATTTGSWVINLSQTVASSGSPIALTATPVTINVTVNSGTILPGTVISGSTSIPSAQNLAITGITGNGITVSVTYATQSAAPFIAGQSITISGVTGSGNVYNGVWTVTGATTTLVQFSSALSVTSGALGTITSAGAFICANGTGSGNTGTYYVACSNQLSTASLSLIGTYYTVNNSQTVLQTSTINGNQTIGYITLFGSGTGGAGTYTVSTALALSTPQIINGVNYTVNQSQSVSATQITGLSNVVTVASSGTTGMVVGETVALTGGSAAVTPNLTASTVSTNALTLSSGTGVTAGLAIVPTAVTYTPSITNVSPLSNYVTFSGTGASSVTQGMSFVPTAVTQSITASATVNASTSLTSSTINASGVLTTGGGAPQVGMVITGTGVQVAQNIQITATAGSGITVTLTYATQGSVPFLTGQLITVQGVIPAAYNGTFVVTGTPTTTQVQYSSNATGSMTTAGNVISLPTYIVSGSSNTWQLNWTTGAAQASLTTFTGTANLITVNSTTGLAIGSQFTTPGTGTFGNLVPNTPYYITAIVPTTNQISVATTYQGTSNVTLTSAAAAWTATVGQNMGGLNSGTTYYIASLTNNSGNSSTAGTQYYATLSTSPTLTPVLTFGWGAGAYTSVVGGVLGGTTPVITSTASGGNLLQLSNTNNIVLGQIITPVAVSQSLSVTSTVNATASLTTSTISTAGVLTVGGGTPTPGMILTGTGVQVVQNIATTAITGNGTTATVTYATQGSVPFFAGQLITIQGAVPASYNGTWTVTGSPTTTQVQFANTTLLTATTQGIVTSLPTYVVSQITATTWQTNLFQAAAVGSTTITGTANLIGVGNATNIVPGQTFTTPGSGTFGNLVASTTYYVKAVSPLTNQISVSSTYFGADFAVTGTVASPTTGSFIATSSATYGSLTSGTPYYVSSIPAPGYVTLATNATLATPVALSMGNGVWTISSNGIIGGINSGQVYYVVSGGANTTISPSPSLTPVLQLTSGTANWTTSVSSSFGGLAYSSSSANYYITEIISSTQLALSTSYFGPNTQLATATGGSVTVTTGGTFGGLTSGSTYYVASITGNQVTLSTSATLTPTITVTNGNSAWTSLIGTTSSAGASSPDGINWTIRALPSNSWSGVTFGNPNSVPTWSLIGTNSTVASTIPNFTTAQARVTIASNTIASFRMIEPGSGYTSTPTITITDPNVTSAATWSIRIGAGALGQPSFTNRGTGYSSPTATVSSSVGYADSYQVGQYFNVQNLPSLPVAGSNVVLAGNAIYYKLVLYSSAIGTQAIFTGYISGTTLYVTNNVGQTITAGMYLQAFGITTPVSITGSALTGSGVSTTSSWTITNNTNGNIGTSSAPVSITAGTYSATFQINPVFTAANAPVHGTVVTSRILYSQVRLTGHDFLSIGTGNIVTTNYPNTPTQLANTANQTVQNGGGRVFFTSTDQDGNFNVGNLFSVQQSTGVATLNANAFNLAGLQTLTLGSVALGNSNTTITQFSTDGTFSANSDNIVPTQKAIRTYITSQIGGGASSINVNTLIAGYVQITGQTISNTNNTQINVRNKMYFKQGVDGSPLALNYFLLK